MQRLERDLRVANEERSTLYVKCRELKQRSMSVVDNIDESFSLFAAQEMHAQNVALQETIDRLTVRPSTLQQSTTASRAKGQPPQEVIR